jgi:hypothetical protein
MSISVNDLNHNIFNFISQIANLTLFYILKSLIKQTYHSSIYNMIHVLLLSAQPLFFYLRRTFSVENSLKTRICVAFSGFEGIVKNYTETKPISSKHTSHFFELCYNAQNWKNSFQRHQNFPTKIN